MLTAVSLPYLTHLFSPVTQHVSGPMTPYATRPAMPAGLLVPQPAGTPSYLWAAPWYIHNPYAPHQLLLQPPS